MWGYAASRWAYCVSINLPHLRHLICPINCPLKSKALQQGQRNSCQHSTLFTCVVQVVCDLLNSFSNFDRLRFQFIP